MLGGHILMTHDSLWPAARLPGPQTSTPARPARVRTRTWLARTSRRPLLETLLVGLVSVCPAGLTTTGTRRRSAWSVALATASFNPAPAGPAQCMSAPQAPLTWMQYPPRHVLRAPTVGLSHQGQRPLRASRFGAPRVNAITIGTRGPCAQDAHQPPWSSLLARSDCLLHYNLSIYTDLKLIRCSFTTRRWLCGILACLLDTNPQAIVCDNNRCPWT